MRMRVALVIAVAGAGALLLSLRGRHDDVQSAPAAESPASALPSAATEAEGLLPGATPPSRSPSVAPPATAPIPVTGPSPASGAPAPSAAAAEPPQNSVTALLRHTDAADRTLLADVEKQTHADPGPLVQELLALRRHGASRAELEHFIDDKLAGNLVVRAAARHWLDAAAPTAGESAATRQAPAPTLGAGGGRRHVQPISRVSAVPKP